MNSKNKLDDFKRQETIVGASFAAIRNLNGSNDVKRTSNCKRITQRDVFGPLRLEPDF